jgi:hypothetical protein
MKHYDPFPEIKDDYLSPAIERGIKIFAFIVVFGLIYYLDPLGFVRRLVGHPISDSWIMVLGFVGLFMGFVAMHALSVMFTSALDWWHDRQVLREQRRTANRRKQ